MFITKVPTRRKDGEISHLCILLRESYREDGKVKSRTIANLTHSPAKDVEAMKLALKHKGNLSVLGSLKEVELYNGKSVGAVWVAHEVAKRLGIVKALGNSREGKLALWQVMSRVIEQGSRLSAVRMAGRHTAGEVLGIKETFNEEHLYQNLGWLTQEQERIEDELLRSKFGKRTPELFLYDVTSSYLEGTQNELGNWGYNRDKKRGKQQIVVGLLCDQEGEPVSVDAYEGNTKDLETFAGQVDKSAGRWGCSRVTFVGDRGIIKSKQIKQLGAVKFNYITAITKSQVRKLINDDVFQLGLFDNELHEVSYRGDRYILRRNPQRAEELAKTRRQKTAVVVKMVEESNQYLKDHKRATPKRQLREIREKISRLKAKGWLSVKGRGRHIRLIKDQEALDKLSELDGCYVIKTDLDQQVDKQIVHDRYKDLTQVEQGFRTCKTELLEMRPWYVRKESSSRAHALIVMLAYKIVRQLKQAWNEHNVTVEEGLRELATICTTKVKFQDRASVHKIPQPSELGKMLLESLNIKLPEMLPDSGINVVSRKQLPDERKNSE